MKLLTLFTFMMLFSISSFCQKTEPSNQLTKEEYLKKSRTQKTIGFALLGAGLTTFAILAPGNTSFDVLGTLVVVGGVLTVGSIPFFISAGKNKRRASAVAFEIRSFKQPGSVAMNRNKFAAIALKLPL